MSQVVSSSKNQSSKRNSPKKIRLSLRKKLLFATVTTIFGLLGVEFILFLFGVQPIVAAEDPYVGFAGNVPLFVASNNDTNINEYRTADYKLRWFNDQRFPVKKSSKAYRIFSLGGSTTYGHPYKDDTSFSGWLREILPQVDKSKDWEVINCGGISYASYRAAKLMEELCELEPDLFIIYTGHNEFLEARTYSGLKETPTALLKLGSIASRTRTFSLVSKLTKSREASNDQSNQQGKSQNLLSAEVNTLLDSSIGPVAYHRDDEHRKQIVEHFAFNLQRMTHLARSKGAKVIFVTPASNLGDCSPFKSEIDSSLTGKAKQDWGTAYNQANQLYRQRDYKASLSLLNRTISLDSRNADSLYLRGRVLKLQGDYDGALKDFTRARDEDVCTLRAPSEIIEAVRKSSESLDVPLIDFEKWVRENSPDGIPGDSLFLDHVHGTIEAYRELAVQLIPAMKKLGALDSGALSEGTVQPSQIEAASRQVMNKVDSKEHGIALRNISKVYSWAGKKEDADRVALRALELTPDDADTIYQAANAYVRLGEVDKAIALYPKAAELQPEFAASVEASLGYAYGVKGDEDKNIEHYLKALDLDPNYSDIHYNIATIFEKRNELDKAEKHYLRAIAGIPNHVDAHFRLGLVFAKQQRWQQARDRLQAAVKINPTLIEPRLYLGKVLIDLGENNSALEQFRWILAREPNHQEALKDIQRLKRSGDSQ
jgi:tetratricopeptide (TPR) repeat protein